MEKIKNEDNNGFRTIHYLGSKLRVLDEIKKIVDDLDGDYHGICDLFAGTGSVSRLFSSDRKVISVDVQNYSNVICKAILLNENKSEILEILSNSNVGNKINDYKNIFEPLIKYEENVIKDANLEIICHFIEHSSLYTYLNSNQYNLIDEPLSNVYKEIKNRLELYDKNTFLVTRYLGGIYFSYKQAIVLDALIDSIGSDNLQKYNILNASIISTASDIVNTVGKHFAQPLKVRDKFGTPKKNIINSLKRDRDLNVYEIFEKWINKYLSIEKSNKEHKVLNCDFKTALENIDDDVKIIYADPPYTRDHYSRFYHGLETISLRDYPKIANIKINGTNKLTNGLYRLDRVQSNFCIRSKAPIVFEDLFRISSNKNKILVISYSPYDKSKNSHPRVVDIEFLEKMAIKYFDLVEIKEISSISHNKLNKRELHLETNNIAEILLICKNK